MSVTLFHVRGVPIRAHWTLLLVIPYLAVVLSSQFDSIAVLAGVDPARLVLPPIVWGALLALALFASVAVHELAHTLLAIRYGGRVRSITLMLVGGVSQLSYEPRRPRDEAIMAAAGPATSLGLGAALAILSALFGGGADLQMTLFYLGAMNISLGLFNLLPAFPLDGGRVLRAVLAVKLERRRATQIAVTIGKLAALALGFIAITQFNLLLGLVAVFVYSGAAAESADEITDVLMPLHMRDLLPEHRAVPVIDAAGHLDDATRRMAELDRLELVVTDSRGPIAVVEADDVPRLARSHASWPLESLASQLPARFTIVSQDDSANAALEAAAENNAGYVVVVAPPATVVGLIGPSDITRAIKLRAARESRHA
jgi:Zn-dependent protease